MDMQEEEDDSSLSPKAKKSPSLQMLEGTEDSVVILDAGAQYGKVRGVAGVNMNGNLRCPYRKLLFVLPCQNLINTAHLACILLTNFSMLSYFTPY